MAKHIQAVYLCLAFALVGCAGMKVIHPGDKNKNEGTKAVDWSGGKPKIVSTFTCKLESTGKKYEAVGKTEEEARKEVLARCRDNAMLTFCKAEKTTCVKN